MMKNYEESVEINHNLNWSYIPDHPHRTLINGGSGSAKTNVLLNLIKHKWPDIDTIHIYTCQRSIRINVSVTYQWEKKSRD